MARTFRTALLMAAALAYAPAAPAAESDAVRARDDRIADLERKLEVVVDELARVRTQVAVPEVSELKSAYGFGPAASKIYGVERGLSIGGYGEGFYTNFDNEGDTRSLDTTDMLRLVLYFGYKFTDNIIFNSEIEIEHGDEIFVEFANFDFKWKDEVNFRAGLLLAPVGFVNEIHEPPFFFGVQRPFTERVIIPSTWRENGAGIFGSIGETLQYRTYVMTSLDGKDFSASGIRGGRQKGSQSLSEDFGWVGRLDWTPDDEWLLGGSLFVGKTGQDQIVDAPGMTTAKLPGSRLTLGEVHAQFRRGPFHSRALFAMSHLANADDLTLALRGSGDIGSSETIAEEMLGGYVEVAYDVWELLFGDASRYLAPFLRVEYVDTQYDVPSGFEEDRNKANWIFNPGLQYKPHPNVVLKMDWRNFQPRSGDRADELSFGFGYAF